MPAKGSKMHGNVLSKFSKIHGTVANGTSEADNDGDDETEQDSKGDGTGSNWSVLSPRLFSLFPERMVPSMPKSRFCQLLKIYS